MHLSFKAMNIEILLHGSLMKDLSKVEVRLGLQHG